MKTLLHVFFMLFPFSVFGNDENNDYGDIRGIALTSDGHPAVYVSVELKSTGKGTITDDNGNFEFKKIKPGTYTLLFSLLEYIQVDTTVQVTQNATVFLRIQLHRTYAELKKVIVEARIPKYIETKTSESLRLNLPLIEVPQNIVVVPHQLLSEQGLVSMTEAIRNVSGVTKYYGTLNDYSLIIRGINATYSIFRNGVGGYWFNQQEDVAMLEKIEFVKGPAGFMGSPAEPGGFVNNVTKQPTRERIARVDAGFGSFNLMRLTADLGGAFSKSGKFYYRFNAGLHKQGRAFRFGEATRYFICPALKYEFNQKTSVTAEYNYMYGKTSGNNENLPDVNGEMFVLPRNFAVADPATDAITAIDNYYRLHLKHKFNDSWNLNAQVASVHGPWGGYTLRSDLDIPITNDTIYRVSAYDHYINYSNPAQVFVDGKFQTGMKIEHKVLFGVDYHNEGSKGSNGSTWGEKKFGLYFPGPDYYVDPDSLKNFEVNWVGHNKVQWISLYMQDHIKIAGKLVVTLAGNLTHAFTSWEDGQGVTDDQNKTSENVFTPRAGLTWLFGDNISVYALYDQCFLPQAGTSFEGKPFKPLTGFNIETGLKSYFFNERLSMNFSIFNIVKNNVLTADPIHPNYSIQAGQVTSKGIDFDMTGYLTNAIILNANYEYSKARISKDSDPNIEGGSIYNTPDHRANLWLTYKLQHKKLKGVSFALGNQFVSKRRATNIWDADKTKFFPGYYLLDASLGYSNDKFNIGLNIYNITNINYVPVGYFSQTGGWRYTPGEPVNFRLSFGVYLSRLDNKPD